MSYSTGIIYKIICTQDSDIVYIGSTFNSLRNRWQVHEGCYKRYLDGEKDRVVSIYPFFQKYGIENFKIIRIKEYECCRENRSDRKHLNVYEQLWINKTRNCINKVNPFRIDKLAVKLYRENNKDKIKQYMKEYQENNKDEIRENKKIYYENNKDKIREIGKIYRENNKDEIRENKKQYYLENKDEILEKEKIRYENHKERIKERVRLYAKDHKVEIKERGKIYRENNKDEIKEKKKQPIFCIICKSSITSSHFKRHTRTPKHIQNSKQVIYNFIISKF